MDLRKIFLKMLISYTRIPAGRWGVPDDLSRHSIFLASSASDFVTGTFIPLMEVIQLGN